MVAKPYVPDRGDIIWIDFDPTKGHEQNGRRPALVLSPKAYNAKVGLALLCPITSHVKNYPFEVGTRVGDTEAVVLSDHLRSLDWKARHATKIQKASVASMQEVQSHLSKLIL
jgi:mRNA interferase MazF